MRLLPILPLCLFLISCGASVSVDYDKEIDFSSYTTYNFYPSIKSGLSELDDKRIMRVADSLLQQRGMLKADDPELYINFFVRESVSNSRSTIGVGLGTGGGNVGVGVSGGIPIGGKTIDQELTVDFIDVKKDDLIWQAVSNGKLKEKARPSEKERYYSSILIKILSKYPYRTSNL